jgi:hypothetical protein
MAWVGAILTPPQGRKLRAAFDEKNMSLGVEKNGRT